MHVVYEFTDKVNETDNRHRHSDDAIQYMYFSTAGFGDVDDWKPVQAIDDWLQLMDTCYR